MSRFKTFNLDEDDKTLYKSLREDNDLKEIPSQIMRILFNRGIKTKEDIMYNLYATTSDLSNISMRDMFEFSYRIIKCINDKEKIVVMGDYDTDGCMATTIMVYGLRRLGLDVDYYMNSRFVNGYGLKNESVDEIRKLYPNVSVIITVDNGIKSFKAVDYCNTLGIDVLITDHHEPSSNGLIPNAYAVVDPKRGDCLYPFKGLCGAGVAYKCIKYLYKEYFGSDNNEDQYLDSMLWVVGIATIGDQVPLIFENRVIVKETLAILNNKDRRLPFIDKIKLALEVNEIKSDTIAFYISPMINAMGRIEGNTLQVIEALLTDDESYIDEVVHKIVDLNKTRREMTSEQCEIAIDLIKNKLDNRCLVVASDKFTEGIVGLVAGRLTEKYHKPVLAMCIGDNGVMHGSGRSIEGINLLDALDNSSSLFISYGGHEMAGGFSLSIENLEELDRELNSYMDRFDSEIFVNEVMIDLVVSEDGINIDLCKLIECLEPYGNIFPKPKVFLKNFNINIEKSLKNKCNSYYVGSTGETLRLVNSKGLVSIGFKSANKFKSLGEPSTVSMIGCPSINEYNGFKNAQFVIENDYVLKGGN